MLNPSTPVLVSLKDIRDFMDKNGKNSTPSQKAEVRLIRVPNRNSQGVIVEDDSQWSEEDTNPAKAERILAGLEMNGEATHDVQIQVRVMVPFTPQDSGWMNLPAAQEYIDSFK